MTQLISIIVRCQYARSKSRGFRSRGYSFDVDRWARLSDGREVYLDDSQRGYGSSGNGRVTMSDLVRGIKNVPLPDMPWQEGGVVYAERYWASAIEALWQCGVIVDPTYLSTVPIEVHLSPEVMSSLSDDPQAQEIYAFSEEDLAELYETLDFSSPVRCPDPVPPQNLPQSPKPVKPSLITLIRIAMRRDRPAIAVVRQPLWRRSK